MTKTQLKNFFENFENKPELATICKNGLAYLEHKEQVQADIVVSLEKNTDIKGTWLGRIDSEHYYLKER